MRWRRILPIWIALGCAHVYAMPTKPSLLPAESKGAIRLRVLLSDAVAKAQVSGFDLSVFHQGRLAAKSERRAEWEFRCHDGRIRATPLTERGPGVTLNLKEPVQIQTPAGFLRLGGRPFREELVLYSNGSFCEVINVLDIEKYLDGLVNAEFSSRWAEGAVEAQVVAARTYAYYQMLQARQPENRDKHYDVESTIRDQVYDGPSREDFRASRAVKKSHGLVLTVGAPGKAKPLKAFYHSTCGGVTELPENVWGNAFAGFKRSVKCGYCWPSPTYIWDVPMTGREIANLLRAGAKRDGRLSGWPLYWERVLQKGQLVDVRISHFSSQGRALQLKSFWADGPQVVELVLSGTRFREWVGSTRLKSAVFKITSSQAPEGRMWSFVGKGHGHGVGMCQWGAKVMGDKGLKMAAILKHYYPDATLRRLW